VVAAKYTVLEDGVENGGIVSGRIIYDGTPPPARMLKVDEDTEVCGSDDRPSEELLVNNSGGIKNVVLSIEDIESGKQWTFPEEFVYDQKKCTFVPRILLIKPKGKGVVLNSDSVGHNFHTISKGIYSRDGGLWLKPLTPFSLMRTENFPLQIFLLELIRSRSGMKNWVSVNRV
jgi:hypothetical protein